MSEQTKLLARILSGQSDNNIPFDSLCHLLVSLGFEQRIRGDHHIFTRDGIPEILNIQPRGSQTKAYRSNRSGWSSSGTNWEEMMPIRYELIVYWSAEDQSYIVEVPELPGCMADGATYQEAVANAEVVIGEWIQTARELGRAIPEPRGRLMYA